MKKVFVLVAFAFAAMGVLGAPVVATAQQWASPYYHHQSPVVIYSSAPVPAQQVIVVQVPMPAPRQVYVVQQAPVPVPAPALVPVPESIMLPTSVESKVTVNADSASVAVDAKVSCSHCNVSVKQDVTVNTPPAKKAAVAAPAPKKKAVVKSAPKPAPVNTQWNRRWLLAVLAALALIIAIAALFPMLRRMSSATATAITSAPALASPASLWPPAAAKPSAPLSDKPSPRPRGSK
ncbi:MAG: hypothetical protein Q7R91_01965 [bacterium]|nr:hypothetical protein [bacterium]